MIINSKTPLGGATYPFLDRLSKKWFLQSWDIDEDSPQLYDVPKCLRWINGDHVTDLYIEGLDTADFLEQTGLKLHMEKGGFVLSKRLSRLMRPYFMYGFFEKDEISVKYISPPDPSIQSYQPDLNIDINDFLSRPDPDDAKVWDGAGRVRRSVLLRVLDKMPPLSAAKQKEMEDELRHAKRIEFTMMGRGEWSEESLNGQDKGHLAVFEDDELAADFVLPQDTKGEVTLEDGTVFIGFYPVHHADTMRLDIQSLVNLWGFFTHDKLMKWLDEEGQLFLQGIQNGKVARIMGRIDQTDVGQGDEAFDAICNWYIREYLASGGDVMWFGSIVKGLMNQHLKRLNASTLNRFRLPIPGGRYYIMVDEIGKRLVESGYVELDSDSSTAWVNAEDWVTYIADVLGGADQDDAVWVFPFEDYGLHQLLIWRSPNQLGEYVVLEPTSESDVLVWETATGVNNSPNYPGMNINALPPRIDTIEPNYMGLVDARTAGGLGEWLSDYSIEGMDYTLNRARQNRGALGAYCNALLLARALYGVLPAQPPAPLEEVIDGSVKNGTDLGAVKAWCLRASRRIVETRKAVPARLQDRLSLARDEGKTPLIPVTSTDHWFDRLVNGIEEHIRYIEIERDELMTQTVPPLEVFNIGYLSDARLQAGSRLNQTYTASLPWVKRRKSPNDSQSIEDILNKAYQTTVQYLEQTSRGNVQAQYELLLAAAAHYYSNPAHIGRDESIWQVGPKNPHTGLRESGIAQQMIQALREAGVLDQLSELDNGRIICYPSARVLATPRKPIKIVGVWFNYWRFICKQDGKPVPERMQEVTKEDQHWAQAQVTDLAYTTFPNMMLEIRQVGERAVAYTEQDNIFGYIAKESTADVTPGKVQLRFAIAKKEYYWVILSD